MDTSVFKDFDYKTPEFSLKGEKQYARVVDIYDGDTLSVVIRLFDQSSFFKFQARLQGIDTCELKSASARNKELARKARFKIIETLCPNNPLLTIDISKNDIKSYLSKNIIVVWVECFSFDKFGRLLIDIFPTKDSQSLSDMLLSCRLAYPYHGETKLTEDEQLEVLI